MPLFFNHPTLFIADTAQNMFKTVLPFLQNGILRVLRIHTDTGVT